MSTPDERKTLQVSPAVHTAVYELATRLETSADGALRHLLDKSTIRVQLTPEQHARWGSHAYGLGVSLSTWVVLQVERALEGGPSRKTVDQIFYRVKALCAAAGLPEPKPDPSPKE